MTIAIISDDAVALNEIDLVLEDLERERKAIDLKIAALSFARTCLLTEIRDVSNLLTKGQNHAYPKSSAGIYQQQHN